MAINRWYKILINGEERDGIRADSFADAKRIARELYGRRCDVI